MSNKHFLPKRVIKKKKAAAAEVSNEEGEGLDRGETGPQTQGTPTEAKVGKGFKKQERRDPEMGIV